MIFPCPPVKGGSERFLRAGVWVLLFALLPLLAPAADIPPLKARVTDLTGTLNGQQRDALEQTLAEFEARKGAQVAVLMVASTQPETIEEYAVRVEEAWKLGRKGVDDSALLVIAKNDRRLRIEVGYGLEGALPDAIAKRIIDNDITPRFKQGDFYGGIRAGVDRIIRVVEGEKLPPPAAHGPSEGFDPGTLVFLFFFVVIAGGVLRSIFGRVLGAGVAGGVAGFAGWMLLGSLAIALGVGVLAFIFMLLGGGSGGVPRRRGWGTPYGGWGGGSWGGGGFSGGGFGGGGGFSGGGGSSGGGGASGSW